MKLTMEFLRIQKLSSTSRYSCYLVQNEYLQDQVVGHIGYHAKGQVLMPSSGELSKVIDFAATKLSFSPLIHMATPYLLDSLKRVASVLIL